MWRRLWYRARWIPAEGLSDWLCDCPENREPALFFTAYGAHANRWWFHSHPIGPWRCTRDHPVVWTEQEIDI